MAKPTRKKTAARPIVPIVPKGYDPTRVMQRLSSDNLFESLGFDPKYVPWMFVDNVIQRVLARTMGQGPFGPVTIKCNEEGALFVAGLGGGYTRNVNLSGSAPDAYAAALVFPAPVGRIDIFTYDNVMLFKRSRDNVTWDDEYEIFKDSFYSLDCTTKAFNVQNKVALSVARYTVVGYY
jgi:hypothetical protein